MHSSESQPQTPVWKVAGVVGFYMAVALVMVMVNKWVLTNSSLPLTFLLLQLSIAVVLLHVSARIPALEFKPPRWSRAIVRAVAPVCAVNVIGLVFNIYCLKLVDASYFQVARGLTLPMTVVLQTLSTGERPTGMTILSCGLVTWGFTYSFIPNPWGAARAPPTATVVAGAAGGWMASSEAPMLGMFLGVMSAAMVAVHAVLVKSALKAVDGRTMDLAYWQNALSALALLPGIVGAGELKGLARLINGEGGSLSSFVIGSGITGVVGFLICLAGLLSIKVTSPVTHMFSAAVRSVLQTMLGVWLFKDVLNASRIMSTLLIILGGVLYTWHKAQQHVAKSNVPGSPSQEPLLSEKQVARDERDEEKMVGARTYAASYNPRP